MPVASSGGGVADMGQKVQWRQVALGWDLGQRHRGLASVAGMSSTVIT